MLFRSSAKPRAKPASATAAPRARWNRLLRQIAARTSAKPGARLAAALAIVILHIAPDRGFLDQEG